MPEPEPLEYVEKHERQTIEEFLLFFENLDKHGFSELLEEHGGQPSKMGRLDANSIPALAEALAHPNLRSRVVAAWMLSVFDDERPGVVPRRHAKQAVEILLCELTEGTVESRLFPLIFLAGRGGAGSELIPALQKMLADQDIRIRICAAAALSRVVGNIAPNENEDDLCNTVSLRDLTDLLESGLCGEDETLKVMAAAALSRLGFRHQGAVDILATVLGKTNSDLRLVIIQALGDVPKLTKSAVKELSKLRENVEAPDLVRKAATTALTRAAQDTNEIISILLEAIQEGDVAVFNGCMTGLIQIGDLPIEVVQILCEMLNLEIVEARGWATWWLSQNKQAATHAAPCLIDRFGKEQDADVFLQILKTLAIAGLAAVPPLLDVIRGGDMRKSPYAQAALVEIGSESVKAVAGALLSDSSFRVRAIGIMILRDIGPRAASAGPLLLDLLKNASEEEKALLVMALIAIGANQEEAIGAMVQSLLSPDADTAYCAKIGLVKIGGSAVPFLNQIRMTAAPDLLPHINEALARIAAAGHTQMDPLEAFGDDDKLELFAWVGHLLGRYGRLSTRRLQTILEREDPEITGFGAKVTPTVGTSASQIGKTIRIIEKKLCGDQRLIVRLERSQKSGVLTARGKSFLRDVQLYLKKKKRWMNCDD